MIVKDKNLKFTINIKPKATDAKGLKARPGFNGYGETRSGQNVSYGTYSQFDNRSGIYYIKCIKTNKYYIGSTKNITARLVKHFSQLRKGNHPNNLLLEDFNKYSQSAFTFDVLEYTDEDIHNKERDYQLKYGLENLYNLQIKDIYHSPSQIYSWNHRKKSTHQSEEYRDKMRNIKRNKIGKFTLDGHLLEIFDNSDEASNKCNTAKSTILGCCNGSKNQAFGFTFRYLDKNNNVIDKGKGKNRTIIIQNEDIV